MPKLFLQADVARTGMFLGLRSTLRRSLIVRLVWHDQINLFLMLSQRYTIAIGPIKPENINILSDGTSQSSCGAHRILHSTIPGSFAGDCNSQLTQPLTGLQCFGRMRIALDQVP